MLFVWKMEHCYSKDLFSDYELSPGKTFSHERNHLLVMNKHFKEKILRKNNETTKVFTAMRKHSLQNNSPQNNFFQQHFRTFGTIFWTDHTELDFGLIHGHAHSPSISFSFVVISLIIQLFISRHIYCIGISDSNIEIFVDSAL